MKYLITYDQFAKLSRDEQLDLLDLSRAGLIRVLSVASDLQSCIFQLGEARQSRAND